MEKEHKSDKDTHKWDQYGKDRLLSRNRLLFEHHRLLTKYFLDFFKDIPTSSKILDVGCGDGLFLEMLRNLGFNDLFGIDLSSSVLRRARLKGLKVARKSIYDIDDKGMYDGVLLLDVLEHLEDPDLGLSKVYASLKPGGFLFLDVPVCQSLQRRFWRLIFSESVRDQMKKWDETHIGSYSRKELKRMVEKNRFAIEKTRTISNPFPLVWVFSKKASEFLQQFTFFGLFGDLFTIIARK